MHVIFSGYAGTLVSLEDEGEFIILHQDFVIAELPDPPTLRINGLYFRSPEGEYFPATYEMAMAVIAYTIRETEWFAGIDVKTTAPTQEDFKQGRV